MKTHPLASLVLALAACGGTAPAAKTVTVGVAAPAAPSATTVARTDAPKRFELVLAFSATPKGDIGGIALERGELLVNVSGKLRAFDAHGPVAPRASTWKPGDPLVVVGPDAFDPIAQTSHAPALPKNVQCESHAFSFDASRMSANCEDPSEGTVVYVYDTRTDARIGIFKEFQTAAPIRAGEITASGNFIFWVARASGAFEEIKSHVTGPDMSSHSVMSRDETMVFTTVDRHWLTDDESPAQILDPKNGRELFHLERDVDTAFFSPSSQLFAAHHSKNWADLEHAAEHDTTSLTIHDRSGAERARVPGANAEEAAFAPDDSSVAVRFATGALPREFFARDALVVARALVGTRIVHRERDRVRVARIVETEAYRGPKDLACHARAGLTKRTRTLFGPPGHAYVFFIYGMHECFNVVCKAEGAGHAVLVRAAEIVEGTSERADGPGRFARAMGLGRAYDGASLLEAPLFLLPRTEIVRIRTTPRVGVAYAGEWADEPWRFLDSCSLHVSRPPKSAIGRPTASPKRRSRSGSVRRSGT